MYIVTGGAGFIGSAFVWKLNQQGIDDIVVVDNLATSDKWKNLVGLRYRQYMHKSVFLEHVLHDEWEGPLTAVIHMGACSSTTEADADYLMENNVFYSKVLAQFALERSARFLYASSASTYGNGSQGFDDDPSGIDSLLALNMYGYSKQLFDLWVKENGLLDQVVGLKFFNVYGPNEYHKGDMKSVICKAFAQVREQGQINLFKSYHPDYGDGESRRDFVYIKDCVDVMWWLLQHPEVGGIFNLGTGKSATWNELARAVFAAMELPVHIEYIDMPETLRGKYQYFTEAGMDRLRQAGYSRSFHSLAEGAEDYVRQYLQAENPYLLSR